MTKRTAYASSIIIFSKISFKKFLEDGSPKGEILIQLDVQVLWPKKTSEIIPLCHNVNLSGIEIDFEIDKKNFY